MIIWYLGFGIDGSLVLCLDHWVFGMIPSGVIKHGNAMENGP